MEDLSNVSMQDILYNEMREEERICLQDILLNDIWEVEENSQDEIKKKNKNEINPHDFIFTNAHNNIFENYSDHEGYNEVINLLSRTEVTNNTGINLQGNSNFVSGVQRVDIKNFMNFEPVFVKIYHEKDCYTSGNLAEAEGAEAEVGKVASKGDAVEGDVVMKDTTDSGIQEQESKNSLDVNRWCANEAKGNKMTGKKKSMSDEDLSKKKMISADFSDDEIYTPKALKMKREKSKKKKKRSSSFSDENSEESSNISAKKIKQKKRNHISDDNSEESSNISMRKTKRKGKIDDMSTDREKDKGYYYSPIRTKHKEAFSNAFDILVKRKNEKNEEAIKAFNYINLKKRRNRKFSKNVDSYNSNEDYCTNEHRLGSRVDRVNDRKDEKRRNQKKNMDDSKDGCEDIPEKYQHLIDQGLEVNVLRYALSMKMNSNEQVKESDIIGLYDIKKIIKDKIVNVILRPDLFTGLNRAAKGILLFGPPGTGKTMIAKWVASHCKCSFYNVSTSSLFSKYIGETEKIVTCLFKCAEVDNPSILFFDEIDSILGMRKKDEDDTTIRIKNQLLQMIDGINTKRDVVIVIIGATNRPDMIDDAALRRFNKRVYIPLPDLQARKEQIRYIITKHTHNGFQMTEEELDSIAHKLHNWNGSDIYHLCTKCYEYVYDDAVELYNGIENIPNTSIFRAIKYDDFIKAMMQVNTSYKCVFDYDDWSSKHGSL
ncbi:AAA family ATPase [Plasmodium gonderi]|uniref:AAA family ATPase n=1 Tax=Plasmodium gonderi TaxID=77519 RepID=A0A1Y1JC61_PLAGO|nr:AAA family ATPase [Plasmodium gonderi]GAW79258.1 AAA family ATPase [Plasmodium gonderi]